MKIAGCESCFPISASGNLSATESQRLAKAWRTRKVCIATENQVSLPVQRDFEELVIFGIAAFANRINNGLEFGQPSDQSQELLATTKYT